jgi:hypothetical protein
MRRHIVLLFLLVAVFAVTAAAQTDYGYPPVMAGEQLWFDGFCVQVPMRYTGVYNLPWSMPDIIGYEVPVGVCSEPDWFLLVDLVTGREQNLTWVESCGCYAEWTFIDPLTISYTAVTCTTYEGGAWTATLREGQLIFEAHPPQFWHFDPTSPMLTAQINPHGIPPMKHESRSYSAEE